MEAIIVIVVFFALSGYALRRRYDIAKWLKMRDATPEIDNEERRIRLTREIEDAERALRRMDEAEEKKE